MLNEIIAAAASHFAFQGTPVSGEEMHSGNINRTYHLICDDRGARHEYILQRISTYVFKEPAPMMDNIARVTAHLRQALLARGESPERRVLEIIPTRENGLLWFDAEGGCWRAYAFITDAFAYDAVDAAAFYQVGRSFGAFQRLLSDFPAAELYESIPDFHNTAKRFGQLDAAIRADTAGRAHEVGAEIAFLLERREKLCAIVRLIEEGALPLRVTHNDTKSNNVMLDKKTGEPLCVIDLDTVMPGSSLYDYGDAIRFGGNTAAEDERDTSKISLDMEKTEAFTRGFIEETNGILSREELRRLPLGIYVMTGELAARFLTDYLSGDAYWKINSPDHNLVRSRAQIALLRDIERKEDDLQRMVDAMIG